MREREIWIRLLKKQIVNDVAVQCNLIGRSLQKSEDTEETASEVMTPDDEATKPVVARAMTEAFGEVKRVCQQYLITGRDTDDNRLERINEMNRSTETISSGSLGTYSLIPGQSYIIRVITDVSVTVSTSTDKVLGQVTGTGQFEYIPSSNERIKIEGSDGKAEVTYFFGDFGMYELKLSMPASFNISMTETHHIHKLDAPSGTAITLAEGILENVDRKERWTLETAEQPTDLPIHAIREGEVPGIHEVTYESDVDYISIKHDAKSRAGFALGAVVAAEFTARKKGFLGMDDMLQF